MKEIINRLIYLRTFPNALRIVSLIIFGFLVYIGFQAHSTDDAFLKVLRNTNFANLFVWSYWWPLIVVGAVFLGRAWCFVCPVELVTSFMAKIGLKKKRPKWLLSGWGITIFYVAILFIGIQTLKIHRDPTMMAVYLLTIFGVSVLTGLLFERNTFCRYVCPVGFLLGLYARISPIGYRVKSAELCKICKDKSCVSKNYTYNLVSKSCGVDLYPPLIDNTYCILCTGCRKSCGMYNPSNLSGRPNPGFTVVGFAKGLYEHRPLKNAEAFFLLIVSGFVISEILSEWSASNAVLTYLPGKIKSMAGTTNPLAMGLADSAVLFAAVPIVIWGIPFMIGKISRSGLSPGDYLRNFAVAFIPLMAAAHLCKAVLKMSSRIPYLPGAFADMTGMKTAGDIIAGNITVPALPAWAHWTVTLLITVIMAGGIWVAVKTIGAVNRATENNRGKAFYLIPVIYGGIFVVTIALWRYVFYIH